MLCSTGVCPQQFALQEQTRQFSTPHWQNVQVIGDGEPESTIIKSEDSHTFTIRCPNKHESRNEGRLPFDIRYVLHFCTLPTIGSKSHGLQEPHQLHIFLEQL